MESQILQELELIRSYLNTIMIVVVIWFLVKLVESLPKIFSGFKTAWNEAFRNRMSNFQEKGDFKRIIEECEEELKKYPNHVDANWYMALANYYSENNTEAIKYFEKSIDLTPSWEASANEYIEKIRAR